MILSNAKGYALIMVLSLLALLFLLTASFSMSVQVGSKSSLSVSWEGLAINAADSGIQYGLAELRNGLTPPSSANFAIWSNPPLLTQNGLNVCFKVFTQAPPDAKHTLLESYGEVVRGNCGDYSSSVKALLGFRAVTGLVNISNGDFNLEQWSEVTP